MNIPETIKRLENTSLDVRDSKRIIGSIVRDQYDSTKSEFKAFELLLIAFKLDLPQFEEMLNDYTLSDFKPY